MIQEDICRLHLFMRGVLHPVGVNRCSGIATSRGWAVSAAVAGDLAAVARQWRMVAKSVRTDQTVLRSRVRTTVCCGSLLDEGALEHVMAGRADAR